MENRGMSSYEKLLSSLGSVRQTELAPVETIEKRSVVKNKKKKIRLAETVEEQDGEIEEQPPSDDEQASSSFEDSFILHFDEKYLDAQQKAILNVDLLKPITKESGNEIRTEFLCSSLQDYSVESVKSRLVQHLPQIEEKKNFFNSLNSYVDLILNEPSCSIKQKAYVLHCLNHVLKTRAKVMKNSEKIKEGSLDEFKDQGFTRPKVLILLPMKNMAYDVINCISHLMGPDVDLVNKKRFEDEFGPGDSEDALEGRSEEFKKLFSGNVDDCFRVGLKFTRKTVKLYSEFYGSDIIIASPLGLRMIIGSDGDKKRDYDFLSSIEICVLDNASVFLMQNWDHVLHVFKHMNMIPKNSHDADFSRIKSVYLENQSISLRQTIVISDIMTPELNSLFNVYMKNAFGKLKILHSSEGVLKNVHNSLQQIFCRIPSSSLLEADNSRFNYFTEKTLKSILESSSIQSNVCIFISSYFDFVRLRNYFNEKEISFCVLSEYCSDGDISRARSKFFHSQKSFLLITERFHFYKRYKIRNIQHLFFYSLPEFPFVYQDFMNMVESGASSAVALYSKFDLLKLERIGMPLFAWGANSYGQLGTGNLNDSFSPVLSNLSIGNIVGITGGGGHSIAWSRTCFFSVGHNSHGQLGLGHKRECLSWTENYIDGYELVNVACGWNHSLILAQNDQGNSFVFGCGSNEKGQLNITEKETSSFKLIFKSAKKIACGVWHSLILGEDNLVHGFGGAKRHRFNGPLSLPLSQNEIVIDISAGHFHSAFLTNNGLIVVGGEKWGLVSAPSTFRRIETYYITQVVSGWNHLVFIESGAIKAIGRNDHGQLGIGKKSPFESNPHISISDSTDCTICCGSEHSIVCRRKVIQSWGFNEHGNCANGMCEDVLSPVSVNFNGSIILIGSGYGHSFAIVQ